MRKVGDLLKELKQTKATSFHRLVMENFCLRVCIEYTMNINIEDSTVAILSMV